MLLRSADPTDLPHARALLARADLPIQGVDDQFGPAYAVAVHDGTLVGLAGVESFGRYGLLRSVAVAPEWRGHGVGEALVRDRMAWARERGLEVVYLLTTTAARYFPRLGFVTIQRDEVPPEVQASREFAAICPSSAVAMRAVPATASP